MGEVRVIYKNARHINVTHRGDHGRLGHGDTASLPYPKLVSALRGIPVISISSGGGHNAALTGTLSTLAFLQPISS